MNRNKDRIVTFKARETSDEIRDSCGLEREEVVRRYDRTTASQLRFIRQTPTARQAARISGLRWTSKNSFLSLQARG